jgi:hypothetical protein
LKSKSNFKSCRVSLLFITFLDPVSIESAISSFISCKALIRSSMVSTAINLTPSKKSNQSVVTYLYTKIVLVCPIL